MTAFIRFVLFGICVACVAIVGKPAFAQDNVTKYPTRPIHVIVGFAAGGGNDIIARIFAQKLSEDFGQPVIVENKPGAGAILATEYVAKSAPDGYTLLVGASGMAINQSVYARLPYDSLRDFTAISQLVSFPLILIVNAASPIKSVADLVAYAKANADKTNYASSSASFQLVTELFKQNTGAPMQAIPYKSSNEMVLAVVSGQVTAAFADAGPASPQVKAGTLRALAVTAEKRMDDFPDVPTMREAGTDIDASLWSGMFAPKGTPPEIARRLERELVQIAKLPDVVARLNLLGIETVGSSTSEFTTTLASDVVRWGNVARAANIRVEP